MNNNAIEIVERFWELMATNNFRAVGDVLADNYLLEWPQSNERIRGRDNFARINEEYPSHGRWQFSINRMVAGSAEVVTDVSVTDGVQSARVISFFTVANGRITKQVEFWPENYTAPENRKHLVEPIE